MEGKNLYRVVARVVLVFILSIYLSACINLPPVPDAGDSQSGTIGETISLDASGSWDINGSDLSFQWTFQTTPVNSQSDIVHADSVEAEFIPDVAGEYVIELEVNDGKYTVYDYVTILIDSSDANNVNFAHTKVSGACIDCHDGDTASNKPSFHLESSDVCESCHSMTQWRPAITVDHTQVVGDCVSCHDNAVAIGKNPTHIATTDACSACHHTTDWLTTLLVDHAEIIGVCKSCHNGTSAIEIPGTHIDIGKSDCDVCHNTNSWTDMKNMN